LRRAKHPTVRAVRADEPSGALDTARGIRHFVAGTGGAGLYSFGAIQPNSQARNSNTHGVLKLTLHASSYDWRFVPVAGRTYTDSGTTACH
jgi:acid phosphatase type 7